MRVLTTFLVVLTAVVATAHESGPISLYIYQRGESSQMMREDTESVDRERIRAEVRGDFFYVRLDGRDYLVTDRTTLDRIETAFAPSRAAREERRAAKEQLRPLQREERTINRSLSRLDRERARAEGRGNSLPNFESRKRELENRREKLQRDIRATQPEYERASKKASDAWQRLQLQLVDITRDAVRTGSARAR